MAEKLHIFLWPLKNQQHTIKGLRNSKWSSCSSPFILWLDHLSYQPSPTSRVLAKAVYLLCFAPHTPSASAKSFNLSVSLFFLNTHPPFVITQATARLVPQPAEFQIGGIGVTVSPLSSRRILTNFAAVSSILHPRSPPKLCRFVWTSTEAVCGRS